MYVRFKQNRQPSVQYLVLQEIPSWEWIELEQQYEYCIKLELLGYVPKRLLALATHPLNTSATDLAIRLNEMSHKK